MSQVKRKSAVGDAVGADAVGAADGSIPPPEAAPGTAVDTDEAAGDNQEQGEEEPVEADPVFDGDNDVD